MAVTVLLTGEFDEWMASLTQRERKEVLHSIHLLQEMGVLLGFPYSSAIQGARYPLRELRPKQGASPLRPIYAFDPRRHAVLLTGGDKGADKAMYERIIPAAEAIWEEHLKDLEDEEKH
jgi:hypothetical protein